jgi:hypothetical protein
MRACLGHYRPKWKIAKRAVFLEPFSYGQFNFPGE